MLYKNEVMGMALVSSYSIHNVGIVTYLVKTHIAEILFSTSWSNLT